MELRVDTPAIQTAIDERLDAIEAAEAVTVLYACEAGSRAWGFASADSDYDVRVVYAHPRDWYLSIDLERRDDAIDPPVASTPDGDVDLHGWDLRKALGLFRDSNPTLLEWLRSPIVYREDAAVMERWCDLIPSVYTPRAAGYAYRGMARSVARQNLRGETVTHKAYLYVLRALLAVRWVEQEGGPIPVAFETLVTATVDDSTLRTAIGDLVTQKREGQELGEGPRLPVLHAFVDDELDRLEAIRFPGPDRDDPLDLLNAFFRDVLAEKKGKGTT